MENLRDLFEVGVREFNQANFFQCHETLERVWRQQADPERQFTQALIQIAVGYHHLSCGNASGAKKLLARGRVRLLAFLPKHQNIDTRRLLEKVTDNLEQLADPQASMVAIQPAKLSRADE